MKKIIVLMTFMLLVTGCSVDYNISINEDLSVEEMANLSGTEEFYEPFYKTTKRNVLKSILENYEDKLKESNYEYKLETSGNPYVYLKKNYSDIDNYINNSILFNDYFDEIRYTKDGNIARLETIGFNPNDPDNPDRFLVRKLDVAITCSYKVVNSNASKIDKKTNTYHFIMNEDTLDFQILLEFDTSSKFNPNMERIITIIVTVLLVVASWIFVFISNKKKKI